MQALKVVRNPGDHRRRRLLAAALGDAGTGSFSIPHAEGSRLLGVGELPGQAEAVAAAQVAFQGLGGAREQTLRSANKRFLVSVLRDGEILEHPPLLRFIVSRAVVDAAARYFGSIPVLSTVRLWWTPVNDSIESSQLLHRDAEGPTQLKFFLNVFAVGSDAGPLTYVPAAVSEPAMRRLGYRRGKLTDEAADDVGVMDHGVTLIGDAGLGAVVDTSRCLHRGSRGNLEERVILMFQFTPGTCPRGAAPSWGAGILPYLDELDPVQRLVLNLE